MRFFLLYLLTGNICFGQDLNLVPLMKSEINNGIELHYTYESTDQHVAIIDLFLFKDGSFEFNLASNFNSAYSIGNWKKSNGYLILNSHLQKTPYVSKSSITQKKTVIRV